MSRRCLDEPVSLQTSPDPSFWALSGSRGFWAGPLGTSYWPFVGLLGPLWGLLAVPPKLFTLPGRHVSVLLKSMDAEAEFAWDHKRPLAGYKAIKGQEAHKELIGNVQETQ